MAALSTGHATPRAGPSYGLPGQPPKHSAADTKWHIFTPLRRYNLSPPLTFRGQTDSLAHPLGCLGIASRGRSGILI
jgi:hypothetical protein